MTEELTPNEQATVERLLRLAYERLVNGGEFVTSFEETHDDRTNRATYEAWLALPPPDVEMFCRLAASSYRLCRSGLFNQARAQVMQDFTTRRVPQVHAFVEQVPEILDLITPVMRDDEQFARAVYVLSQLLPTPAA